MAAENNPFYVKPADAMSALMSGYQGYDRSQKAAKASELEAGRRDAAAALQSGGDLKGMYAQLLGIGDVEAAKTVADFAHQNATAQHQTASLAETGRHNKAIEQAHREGKIPFGWTVGAGGAPSFMPNGPADPTYIGTVNDAKAKPREMSVHDVTTLSTEGGKFAGITGFKDTFKPEFAGFGASAVGSAALTMGRNFPDLVSEKTAQAAQWWQGYDKFKNVVRNELFGSALTPGEKAAFEQADINSGMDEKTIKANLKVQHEVMQNGLKRKANGLIQAGFDPKTIAAAYGVNLDEIGVTATPSRKGQDRAGQPAPAAAATPALTAPAPATGAPKVPVRGEVRDGYRFKGGNPGDQDNWVKVQ